MRRRRAVCLANCQRARHARAFTFIEILVVMTIIAVLAGVVVMNFVGADRERDLETEAQRLAVLIELARTEALSRNESWGLFVEPEEYAFAAYDDVQGLWVLSQDRTFRARNPGPGMSLAVSVEQFAQAAQTANDSRNAGEEGDAGKEAPDILIFASGEQTPFTIEVMPSWESESWFVRSDGIQRTRALREREPL